MKIVHVSTFFYPVHGGVEQIELQLSKLLLKYGHNVKIICSDSSKTKERIKKHFEIIEGIQVERCRTWFSLSHFHKFFPSLFFKLLKSDFDIVHVQGLKGLENYLAFFAAKIKGKKIIASTHNPFVVDEKVRSKSSRFFIKLHDITFGKVFMRFFDKYICLSKSEIPFLEKFGVKKEKVSVIPNALPDSMFIKGNPKKYQDRFNISKSNWSMVVLYLGRISMRKGIQNLKYSIKSLPDILFLIAGPDDGYLGYLQRLFKSYKNVIFLGPIERSETRDVYSLADVFVAPSLYEPFGIVIIEAMAQGLPVLATKIGGPADIVNEDFGFLVNTSDQKEIMEKIKFLKLNEKIRLEMGKKAKIAAERYRWGRIFKKYTQVYSNVMNS